MQTVFHDKIFHETLLQREYGGMFTVNVCLVTVKLKSERKSYRVFFFFSLSSGGKIYIKKMLIQMF